MDAQRTVTNDDRVVDAMGAWRQDHIAASARRLAIYDRLVDRNRTVTARTNIAIACGENEPLENGFDGFEPCRCGALEPDSRRSIFLGELSRHAGVDGVD